MMLADRDARERILRETRRTMFVEAGAGTGKTTALVGRIVALVADGARIDQIAAITFTEKAAAELTDRVRQQLERAAAGDGEYAGLTEEARARCREAAAGIDGAAFQTIHAFARKLLAAHPVQAGLPPEFDVLDETEEELETREQVRRFLDEIEQGDTTAQAVTVGYALGLQPRHLRGLARKFAADWDRLRGVTFERPGEPDWEPPLRALLDEVDPEGQTRTFPEYFAELCRTADRLEAANRAFERAETAEERVQRLVELLTLAARMPPVKLNKGKRGTFQPVKEGFEAWLEEVRAWTLGNLLPAVQTFALRYAGDRRRSGRLTFHDLLVLAVDLLRTDPAARRAVHERFPHLLIDEFQDTDPLQVELAALIAGEPRTVVAWQETTVAQGRLFFVGDPKQSIYRFRRADIRIYRAAMGAFGSDAVQLTTNFRSARRIVAWVNGVCGRLFDDGGNVQAPWTPLEARPDAPEGEPVRVLGGPVEGAGAGEVREREAAEVALGVLRARAENWAGGEGGTRFEDICILLPRRTGLPALERALADRGIPFRIESQSLMYAAEEVRDLANVLTAIDDPTDQVALVAALRSPLFACTDAELAEHAAAGGRWSYEAAVPDGSPERVRRALERLAAWHRERWTMTPAGLIERLLGECHLLLAALGDLRPREAWRRYRIIAEQARALTVRGSVATLRQFIAWLDQQREEGVRVNEAIAPEPDDDAVRAMTIHAAKGLEFPVVFVMGLGTEGRSNDDARVWWPPEGSGLPPEVRCGSGNGAFATAGFAAVEAEEDAQEAAEEARLFYVAATRAEHALTVSLYRAKKGTEKSLAARVERALEGAPPETWERFEASTGTLPAAPTADGVSSGAPPVPERAAWMAARAALAAKAGRAPVAAASTIAHEGLADVPEEPADELAGPEEPWRKGRAGTSLGRAVHAVLQGIDLATGNGLEEAARAQAEAEGIGDRREEVARLARSALASQAVQAAVASGRYWREVYVGAELDGTVVEGFIDLLYESPDGLVIVDYKTDGLRSAEEIDRVMPIYRLQGGAYAAAAEEATGRRVASVVFVFTEPREERTVPDLDEAMREARERAALLMRRGV
ncbi:UvrD-helicase domain-containing protein [Tepidiforma thermophila]|uniref:DNA 3'-5' helicase n=1 Tax=Tepidiforma thermophila (strain KCTC 52669 / CGMCC 1.13589 / G233) TaxID=2761530 RepID=A0A2A9HJJ3_TEPT2|nr:UvrD-helicase domain-containing protein [Tepidiforma thermophila]PFG75300.1 ATP-dependent helicase/nuclease subunit A [Tepidiforma thermophila]